MNFGEKSGTKREVVHFEKTKERNGRKISALEQNTEMVVLIRIIVIIMIVIVIFMTILASKMIINVLIMIILASFFYFGLKDDDNSYLYDNLSLEAQGVETFPLLKQRDGCLCSET